MLIYGKYKSLVSFMTVFFVSTSFFVSSAFAQSVPTKGDINNDGKVDLVDVMMLKSYVLKKNIKIDTSLADISSDGKINSIDCMLLKKNIVDSDTVTISYPAWFQQVNIPDIKKGQRVKVIISHSIYSGRISNFSWSDLYNGECLQMINKSVGPNGYEDIFEYQAINAGTAELGFNGNDSMTGTETKISYTLKIIDN